MKHTAINQWKLLSLMASIVLFIFACKKDEYRGMELKINEAVNVISFSASNVEGVIDDNSGTISLELPFGTDFSSVTPEVEIPVGATIEPAPGTPVNLTSAVKYKVSNGNIYSEYTVTATEKKAIMEFKVGDIVAEINEKARTITAIVPDAVDITKLSPEIVLNDATISPATGVEQDFSNPVIYTVTSGNKSVPYTVTIQNQSAVAKVVFLGTSSTRAAIANIDEATACNWLFANFPNVEYVSFDAIKNGTADLDQVKVIWWHEDATQNLPSVAYDATVLGTLKEFRNNGGAFLLTTYAGQYLEPLGVVPAGKNPNNVFGDATPWIEKNWDWGMSFKGRETHPVFEGLTLTSDKPFATAYLLAKNTYRLNHCAWYKVNEWGGYGNAAGWRSQTGGIDLAGPEWDEDHNNNIGMAEWQRTATNGPVIAILFGSYDWYTEPDPATGTPGANSFKSNIERLTKNSIRYLAK